MAVPAYNRIYGGTGIYPEKREDAGQPIGSVPGMYYEKVYLILTGLHSVIEPHFAGFLHAFSLSQIVDVYKEVVSKLCQKALYPVEDRVLFRVHLRRRFSMVQIV